MIYDELIEELALTLLTKARYEGCISVIDGFSQCEEDKTRIEYPIDGVMRIMPVGSEIWPEECEPLLKKIGVETIGDVADYLNKSKSENSSADEMMSLLANTLADATGHAGCLPILDCFSPHPGEEVTVSIPMCDDTVDIVLEDLDFPHEWEELLENSGADTMGDLVDYLCYCSQNNISLAISPEDEEKLYATLIDVCYENMSYDRQVDFWRHVLETNSLVCEVKE